MTTPLLNDTSKAERLEKEAKEETREGYANHSFIKINKDTYGLAFASLVDPG